MRNAYLVMVNGDNNNNKFYNMIDNGNGTWTAEYGRIGKSATKKVYYDSEWYKKYDEKLRKGYVDVSEFQEETSVEVKSNIENPEVADLIGKLSKFANGFISKNYRVGSESVTSAQVNRVQDLIAEMKEIAEKGNASKVYYFNYRIEKILTTIPRITVDVKSLLARTEDDFSDILEREQSVLNVMASKVKAQEIEVDGKGMLEAHGLDIKPVTKKEEKEILSHLDPSTRTRFKRAFKVVNKKTNKRFNDFCKKNDYKDGDIKFLYHGSRNQNWMGILQQGLTLNNKAPITGKAFGYGLYGAPLAKKSRGYTSLADSYWNNEKSNCGFIAVMKFAMKNPKHISVYDPKIANAHKADINAMGYDSVYAHAGQSLRNDECIVYDEAQVIIKYLIEVA